MLLLQKLLMLLLLHLSREPTHATARSGCRRACSSSCQSCQPCLCNGNVCCKHALVAVNAGTAIAAAAAAARICGGTTTTTTTSSSSSSSSSSSKTAKALQASMRQIYSLHVCN